jgi:hypothetical protein
MVSSHTSYDHSSPVGKLRIIIYRDKVSKESSIDFQFYVSPVSRQLVLSLILESYIVAPFHNHSIRSFRDKSAETYQNTNSVIIIPK